MVCSTNLPAITSSEDSLECPPWTWHCPCTEPISILLHNPLVLLPDGIQNDAHWSFLETLPKKRRLFGWEIQFRPKESLQMTQNFGQLLGGCHFEDAKLLTPDRLKYLGYTVQMSYEEGQWHHNSACTSPTIFLLDGSGNRPKRDFFVKHFVPENFLQEFFRYSTHRILMQRGPTDFLTTPL